MLYHKQLNRHRPAEGITGDCFRTAIACLLDLEPQQVPHVFHSLDVTPEAGAAAMRQWLAKRGYNLFQFPFAIEKGQSLDTILTVLNDVNPGALFLLSGTGHSGVEHVVIAGAGRIVHDPSPKDLGLSGPCASGFYWLSVLTANLTLSD